MGPVALFDKSFLQSLGVDESVLFDHFFQANVCPIFYIETLADFAKEKTKNITADELVRRIADKFPDWSGSPNLHHTVICRASLLGGEVSLSGQIVMGGGGSGAVSSHVMVAFPESMEAKSFLRWSQGRVGPDERRAAAKWRKEAAGFETAEVIDVLKRVKVYEDDACTTLLDVKNAANEVIGRLRPDQQVHLALQLFGAEGDKDAILARFHREGEPQLSTFARYAAYALRVELFYHIGVEKSRISEVHRRDVTYLLYLPFCQVFVSSDWGHRDCAPLFIRDDQSFVWGQDLKASLRLLNDRYSAMSESERNQSIFAVAPHPPLDVENLVTTLWRKHGGGCPPPQGTTGELRELTTFWQKQIPAIEKIAESGGDPTFAGLSPDAMVQKRVARKRRGSWWRVPEEIRNKPTMADGDVRGIEFQNGTTSRNVVDRVVSVYLLGNKAYFSSMPDCRIFERNRDLWVDCAPPLNRQHAAPVPAGAMVSRSEDGDLGVFVDPESSLGQLVRHLFARQKKRDKKRRKKGK